MHVRFPFAKIECHTPKIDKKKIEFIIWNADSSLQVNKHTTIPSTQAAIYQLYDKPDQKLMSKKRRAGR